MCLHLKSKISFISANAKSSDPIKRTRGIAEGLEQRARILQKATVLRDYVQKNVEAGSGPHGAERAEVPTALSGRLARDSAAATAHRRASRPATGNRGGNHGCVMIRAGSASVRVPATGLT